MKPLLAVLGNKLAPQVQVAVQSNLIQELDSFDVTKQGTALTDWQSTAADALADLIQAGSSPSEEVFRCISRLGNEFGGILHLPDEVISILLQAVKQHQLPQDLWQQFMEALKKPAQENETGVFALMHILAASAEGASDEHKRTLLQQIERITRELSANDKILPECATVLGSLGEQGVSSDFSLEVVSRGVRFKSFTDRPDSTEDPRNTLIADDGEAFAVALGRIAQRRRLTSSLTEVLWNSARNRSEVRGYSSIIAGLAAQNRRVFGTVSEIRQFLSSHSKSFPDRQIAIDLVCFLLREQSSAKPNQPWVDLLRSACLEEEEPEIRTALRRILLDYTRNGHFEK